MTKNLTTGHPAKIILLFTLPLLIGNVFQQLYGFADAFVVGRTISVDALAAVGSTGSLSFLLLGFAWGMTAGFAIPTAQAFGANDPEGVRRSVATGAILTGVFAVVLTAIAVPIARPLLEVMQTPPEIIDDATTFIVVTFWGIGATMFFNFLSNAIRALGDSRTPLIFLAIACVLNVVLVVVFIVTFGMGVEGAALATITSQLVSVLLCLWLVKAKMPILRLSRADWRVTRADLTTQLRLGLPMGFQSSIIAIGALVLQYSLNGLGAESVAAYTAAQKVDGLAVAPMASFGLALATYTAQNYGARAYARIRRGVFQTCLMSVGFSVAIAMINILFGPTLVRLFVGQGEEHVVELAQTYLVLNGVLYFVLGLLFAIRNTLQGLGRTFIPTLSGVMELATRVVAALVLAAHFGFAGVALAGPLAWIAATIPLWLSYRKQRNILRERELLAELEQPKVGDFLDPDPDLRAPERPKAVGASAERADQIEPLIDAKIGADLH
jgi:putative MATE family efflux protein